MNKRIKNKISKGKFKFINRRMLWQHHAYQADKRTREVMLCYAEDGNERYFRNWKTAKAYARTLKGSNVFDIESMEIDFSGED